MASRPTPSWLFALTGTPYGAAGAFTGIIMPYLAKRSGADLEAISWYVALLFVPSFLQFTYAPIVDFGPRRKHWLVLLSAVGAACLYISLQLDIKEQTGAFLGVALIAQFATSLVGSCNGGLMATTMSDAQRGKAGGWYNVGNLAGGGIAAAATIYLIGHQYTSETVGTLLAVMMVAPSLAALVIDEPAREKATTTVGTAMTKVWKEVGDVLLSKSGITGVLLCISPVGTAALANYFSAIADEYVRHDIAGQLAAMPVDQAKAFLDERVSSVVAFVTGPVGQILTTIGAVAGGFLCDRTNRRAMYLLSGVLTAIVGIGMAISPASQMTFTVGALTYALVTGFCYAAFTATVLETIGKDTVGAATRYSIFTAAGNVAITYVGKIDTEFSDQHGVAGVVASDALLNLAGVVVLGIVFWKLGSFGKTKHDDDTPPEQPPAPPELPEARIV